MAKAIFFSMQYIGGVYKRGDISPAARAFPLHLLVFFFVEILQITPKSRVHCPNSTINACHQFFQGTTGLEKQNIPVLPHWANVICEWHDDRSPVETKKLIVESRRTGWPWYRIICIILSWSTI